MPVINCRPQEPIQINFLDRKIMCYINVDAICLLKSEFGDMIELSSELKDKPYDLAALLLYAGVKSGDMAFTLDEAKYIACAAGSQLLDELSRAYVKCCGDVGGEEFTKKYIAELEKIVEQKTV